MKALVKETATPGLVWKDVPVPSFNSDEVLIKIKKTAICGTDIHIWKWDDWAQATVPLGIQVGHEYVGEIVALGEHVKHLRIGERVSGEGHIVCGTCRNCRAGRYHLCAHSIGVGVHRNGAFAEYLSLPAFNVVKLPDTISDPIAAILDPFGNATHTALSFNLTGENVLITGAGPIGIMAVAIARHSGARRIVVTDVNPYRLELARCMGASYAVDTSKESLHNVQHLLDIEEGFDVGLEMSGHPDAFRSLLGAMSHGGKVALLGIPPKETAIDWNQVIFKGLQLKGIYGREMFETWHKMTAMLESGLNLNPIITHHFKASEYQQGFEAMLSGHSGKVILDWENI